MSNPTRLLTLAVAGVVALGALSPASAATRHKRAAAQTPTEQTDAAAPVVVRPDWSPVPSPAWQAPNACVSDEGYGRYSSCDSGDSN